MNSAFGFWAFCRELLHSRSPQRRKAFEQALALGATGRCGRTTPWLGSDFYHIEYTARNDDPQHESTLREFGALLPLIWAFRLTVRNITNHDLALLNRYLMQADSFWLTIDSPLIDDGSAKTFESMIAQRNRLDTLDIIHTNVSPKVFISLLQLSLGTKHLWRLYGNDGYPKSEF